MKNSLSDKEKINSYIKRVNVEVAKHTDLIDRHRVLVSFLIGESNYRSTVEAIEAEEGIADTSEGWLIWRQACDRVLARTTRHEIKLIKKAKSDSIFFTKFQLYIFTEHPDRFDLYVLLGDEASFRKTLNSAIAQLQTEYYDTKSASILALADFFMDARYKKEVQIFLVESFDKAREYIDNQPLDYPGQNKLYNAVAFSALLQAIAKTGDPQFGETVVKELQFMTDRKRHYELHCETGKACLALAQMMYIQGIAAVNDYLEGWIGESYEGEDFVMQARYTKWILESNGNDAMGFMRNPEHTKGLGYAAMALADLNYQQAAELLKSKETLIDNPVTQEIFIEAINRLRIQTCPPKPENRMIEMLGKLSDTELALGNDTDDVFIKRAINKTKNVELGMVYEVDDSTSEDIGFES